MSSINYDSQFYNREIAFCKVYSTDSKNKLEKLFLQHGISYFVEWQEKSWLRQLFDNSGKEKNVYIIRINEADSQMAKELIQGIDSVKIKKNEEMKDHMRLSQ